MNRRIEKQQGEWINRSKLLSFTFEEKSFMGYEGDSITSALLASGEDVLGRSFKYHRPRGVYSLANHDINVMLTDGKDTNIRGDVVSLENNKSYFSVNTIGGVQDDKNRFIELLAPFLPVGFYYKAFHKPRFLFPFWEKIIRKSAGLGVVNFNFPQILKPKLNAHYDVLVVGAGPSGLAAALAVSADKKLRVLLVDENKYAGGSLGYDRAGDPQLQLRLDELLDAVNNASNISIRTDAYASAYYADHLIPIVEKEGITKVRANSVIVASGVFEQPIVFRNNDLPGVMAGSAAQRMIYRYGIKPFENGVIFTANDYGYRVALDLLHAGTDVKAVIDIRSQELQGTLTAKLRQHNVRIYNKCCVYEAIPSSNNKAVTGVVICPFDDKENITQPEKSFTIACDGIAMSAGWAPAAALLYQSGAKMRYVYDIEQFVPESLPTGVFAAGKVNGVYDLEQRIVDGERAASDAMRLLGIHNATDISVVAYKGTSPSHPYPIVAHPKGKDFVDFDEDIQSKDFFNAAKEGFDNIELMKRFTTVGMGPSQGKHSNMNAIRILAKIRNLPIAKIGSTTSRPFFHPIPIGHLSGRNFYPKRQSTIQSWHVDAGAVFTDVGAWSRPAYYKKIDLNYETLVQEEVMAVHNSVGIIDGSSLGKIEIYGPDAAQFLERFFTGKFAKQKVGKTRYVLSIDESAVILDDGVAGRINDDLFYITMGTSHSAITYRDMQRWLQIWQLDVTLIDVTGAYGMINLVGPKAQDVVASVTKQDVSSAAFSLGSIREMTIHDLNIRVIRVAFVSGDGYEIYVPANSLLSVWNKIIEAGKAHKIRPFGIEAQRLLRLEMGHYLPGHDTDGLTTPYELGRGPQLAMDKTFFIGQRSLEILAKKTLTKCLVPFVIANDFSDEMPKDCNLVIDAGQIKGRVTSIAFSAKMNCVIGLAYVDPLKKAVGSEFMIRTDNGSMVGATVVKAPFLSGKKES